MRRCFIVIGDKTTNGGTVLEGEERARNHGKPLSYHGALVYCPACKSQGYIVGDGPSRTMRLHGKQVALENDLCICKCSPPPRLIRSQTNASMSFDGHELARMGYAPDGRRLPGDAQPRFIAFKLTDSGSLRGLRCVAHFDDGSTAEGVFDDRNIVRFEDPSGRACKRVTFSLTDQTSDSTFCSSFVTTLTA